MIKELIQKRKSKPIGTLSEDKVAKRLGAKKTLNSGALDFDKGDMKTDMFLIESKATEKQSFSLKLSYLVKIAKEAYSVQKVPALTVTFVDSKGDPVKLGNWVMIPEYLFKEYENKDTDS